jgi:hypothetical protein
MNDVGKENLLRCLKWCLLSFSLKFTSNSTMVASVWPLTKKKATSMSASFSHYQIIHTRVNKIKTNIPAKNSRLLVKCTNYFLVGFIDDWLISTSIFLHSLNETRTMCRWLNCSLQSAIVCGLAFVRLRKWLTLILVLIIIDFLIEFVIIKNIKSKLLV